MTDSCQKLQTALSDVLQDLMSMSAEVIKKSNVHLKDVEALEPASAEEVSDRVRTLLERVTTNLSAFMDSYNTAIKDFKEIRKNGDSKINVSPKRKLNLSLRKNDRKEDGDVNSTTSDEEPPDKEKNKKESSLRKKREATPDKTRKDEDSDNTRTNQDPDNARKDEDDISETDSEKSIMNFDVPITKNSMEGFVEDEPDAEIIKTLDALAQHDAQNTNTQQQKGKTAETLSFDFDDDDELVAELKKVEISQDTPSELTQFRRDNHELLDLLNKAMAVDSEEELTENDGDEAVKILENEVSYSSDTDSDDSMKSMSFSEDNDSSDDWKPSRPVFNYEDSDSSGNISDTELSDDEKNEECGSEMKEITIDLNKRVDQMSDNELDRLCNIENINKRKCLKALNHLRKRRRKRIRVLSSSSSSLSSDLSSIDSTPESPAEIEDPPAAIHNLEGPDVTALADQLVDILDQDGEKVEISSDSDSEPESEQKKKKENKAEPIKTEEPPDNKSDDETDIDSTPKPDKKKGSWRNDLFFGTSSESDDDDPDVVLNDPLVEKIEEEEEEESKSQVKLKIVNDGETMVITDSAESNSDSDDSVTFVSEVVNDDNSGRGRRNIRAIISDSDLNVLTQKAKNEEDERILRLEEHSKNLETIQSQREDLVLDADVKTGAPLITVDYNLAKMLKPHQKEGVIFMWEACYESVNALKTNPGTGCILAHCMGLGKTLQVITLIHTLFKYEVTKTKHVLVICPLSTVTNWKNEFKQAFKKLDTPIQIMRYFIVKGDVSEKIRTIKFWRQTGGVLVMSYETFQILTNKKLTGRVSPESIQTAYEGLVNPGPDLIICDEGHQLKNDKTLRSKALVQVKTKRRIVLTGTPLQNNLKEYYWMVNFVKPHLLGTDKEYLNRFATPITNGQYHDSRPEDIKLMKKRTHVLNKVLKKTIHRVESGVLSSYLPEIVDYTIFVKLSPLQMELYQTYIRLVTSQNRELGHGYLADVMMLNINNLHPYALQLHYNRPRAKKKKKRTEDGLSEDEEHDANERISRDWFKHLLPEDATRNVEYSPKLKLILDIVDEAIQVGDKILIFGQRRAELDLLENFLTFCRKWRPNFDYYRMDGDTAVENRDQLCRNFNTNPVAKIFLLTHRVGGLGLNLTGANRVIMIGSNHNPSLDAQSMYRVYRFGQSKKCFVYRLLSLATMEEKIYHRCVVKLHLSGTVVDKLHFTRKITSSDLQEMYKVDFSEYTTERPIPIVPSDKLLALLLQNDPDIYKYHPHNSLLENRPEEELTDEDKKLAWDEFNSMEVASKFEARPNNPLFRLPIFPTNLTHSRVGEYVPRGNAPGLVPNPMNNNVRGFIPKGLLPHGMPSNIPQNMFNMHQNTPRPNLRTQGSNALQFVCNPVAPNPRQNFQRWRPAYSGGFPASEVLQNLRENISKVLRRQPPPAARETAPTGEFNYALNKLM